MIEVSPLDYVPLSVLFLMTIAIIVGAAELGYRLGRFLKPPMSEKEVSIGSVVGATVGLLAFTLAFTFGLAASRFDSRRTLFQQEVDAISTTFLRTDLLPEAPATKSRQLIRDYVDLRLAIRDSPETVSSAIEESERMHAELWQEAMVVAKESPNSPLIALYVSSLNEMFDLHSDRVTAAIRARIPGTIWLALYLVSALSMASMGYYVGSSDGVRSIAALCMILCFVIIIMLIADLDRPMEGVLRVNYQAMIDLQKAIQ